MTYFYSFSLGDFFPVSISTEISVTPSLIVYPFALSVLLFHTNESLT